MKSCFILLRAVGNCPLDFLVQLLLVIHKSCSQTDQKIQNNDETKKTSEQYNSFFIITHNYIKKVKFIYLQTTRTLKYIIMYKVLRFLYCSEVFYFHYYLAFVIWPLAPDHHASDHFHAPPPPTFSSLGRRGGTKLWLALPKDLINCNFWKKQKQSVSY